MRNGLLHNYGHDGPKDVTPQFQALMRQSSRRLRWRNKKFSIICFVIVLLIVLIGILLYIFLSKDIIFEIKDTSNQSANIATIKIANILTSTPIPFSIPLNTGKTVEKIHTSTSRIITNSTWNVHQCQNISGFKQKNKVIALLGGINQNGFRSNTIELIPNISCSLLPRLDFYQNRNKFPA